MPRNELVTITFSHYCEKARWALDRFAVPYRERAFMPLLHFPAVIRRSFGGRADANSTRFSTPLFTTNRGEVLTDSCAITAWVDAGYARGALHPNDEARRLEHEFGETLGPHARRLVYFHLLRERELLERIAVENVGPAQAAAFKAIRPLVTFAITRALSVSADRAARSEQRVQEVADAVAMRLKDGRRIFRRFLHRRRPHFCIAVRSRRDAAGVRREAPARGDATRGRTQRDRAHEVAPRGSVRAAPLRRGATAEARVNLSTRGRWGATGALAAIIAGAVGWGTVTWQPHDFRELSTAVGFGLVITIALSLGGVLFFCERILPVKESSATSYVVTGVLALGTFVAVPVTAARANSMGDRPAPREVQGTLTGYAYESGKNKKGRYCVFKLSTGEVIQVSKDTCDERRLKVNDRVPVLLHDGSLYDWGVLLPQPAGH